jgi:hypothetical protein
MGLDHPNEGNEDNPDDRGAAAETCGTGATDESLYTFGSGYAFTCTYSLSRFEIPLMHVSMSANDFGEYIGPTTQHSYPPWMNGSHSHHEQ